MMSEIGIFLLFSVIWEVMITILLCKKSVKLLKKNYTVEKQMKLNVIPNNMEKNMWLSCLVIIWFSFTVSNLCQAVWTSVWVISQMRLLKYTLHPVKKKGVYPYDYMCSFDKLNDTQLPEKEYEHAQKVWETSNLKTIGDYHDLYLGYDVLLLANVFEIIRSTCLQCFKLKPCHYFTSPGLSWDAMLKMTDIKLELMTDIDIFQFIEKGTCYGIS